VTRVGNDALAVDDTVMMGDAADNMAMAAA
jgi:hypothetical protein